jgi:hypothetical protein
MPPKSKNHASPLPNGSLLALHLSNYDSDSIVNYLVSNESSNRDVNEILTLMVSDADLYMKACAQWVHHNAQKVVEYLTNAALSDANQTQFTLNAFKKLNDREQHFLMVVYSVQSASRLNKKNLIALLAEICRFLTKINAKDRDAILSHTDYCDNNFLYYYIKHESSDATQLAELLSLCPELLDSKFYNNGQYYNLSQYIHSIESWRTKFSNILTQVHAAHSRAPNTNAQAQHADIQHHLMMVNDQADTPQRKKLKLTQAGNLTNCSSTQALMLSSGCNEPSERNSREVEDTLIELANQGKWLRVSFNQLSNEKIQTFWKDTLTHLKIATEASHINPDRYELFYIKIDTDEEGNRKHPIQTNDRKTRLGKYFKYFRLNRITDKKYYIFDSSNTAIGIERFRNNPAIRKCTYELTNDEIKTIFESFFKDAERASPSETNATLLIKYLNKLKEQNIHLTPSLSMQNYNSISHFEFPREVIKGTNLKQIFRQYFSKTVDSSKHFFDWDRKDIKGIEVIKNWLIENGHQSRETKNNNQTNQDKDTAVSALLGLRN